MAATHAFDQSLVDTVVCGGVNPLEVFEKSALLVASAVHRRPVAAMVRPELKAAAAARAPGLFERGSAAAAACGV